MQTATFDVHPFDPGSIPPAPLALDPGRCAARALEAPRDAAFPEPSVESSREVDSTLPSVPPAFEVGTAACACEPTTEAAPVASAETPVVVRSRENWTARLLQPPADVSLADDVRRFAQGLGLASAYGVAVGARHGGAAFLKSAALVPAALLAACAFGLPALYIGLGLVDAPVAPRRLFGGASRAVATVGVALAGLAPVAALYVVSSDGRTGAAVAGALGLAAGSLVGLRTLSFELFRSVRRSRETVKIVTVFALFGFAVFAAAVGIRVWSALPLFAAGVR